jgi:hypothetical protein
MEKTLTFLASRLLWAKYLAASGTPPRHRLATKAAPGDGSCAHGRMQTFTGDGHPVGCPSALSSNFCPAHTCPRKTLQVHNLNAIDLSSPARPPYAQHTIHSEHLENLNCQLPAPKTSGCEASLAVRSRPERQRNKPTPALPISIKPLPVANRPFECISLDWLSGFPLNKHGHDSVLNIVCKFSKWAIIIPCDHNMDTEDLCAALWKHLFLGGWLAS